MALAQPPSDAIFGGTTLPPVIKIGMLSCESSAEAAAVAAARQRDVDGSLVEARQQWQHQWRWWQRDSMMSAVAAARQRDVGGGTAAAAVAASAEGRQREARRRCTA
jgi:hypothetical protein